MSKDNVCNCEYEVKEVRDIRHMDCLGRINDSKVQDLQCKKCGSKTVKFIFEEEHV
jgi:hypothetical protein